MKKACLICSFCTFWACCFCLDFPEMPSFSSVASPSMPTISAFQSEQSLNSASNANSSTNAKTTQNSTTQKPAENSVSNSIAGYGLTASTISGLSSLGGFNSLSSLLGDDSSNIYNNLLGNSSLTGNTTNAATNLLLNQILEKLTTLQETINSNGLQNSSQSNETNTTNAATTTNAKSIQKSNIARFRINNYDLLASLNQVFISTPEEDGSFFVTGDRTYYADGKNRSETFYMLFQSLSKETNNPLGNYSVAFSVTQDYANKNSFLYKLSQLSPLTAQKTGNLASIRLNNDSLKVDLLIQIQ